MTPPRKHADSSEDASSEKSTGKSPVTEKKKKRTSGKKILSKSTEQQRSGVKGGSRGKPTMLEQISNSISGLIELQNRRMELESQWRAEDQRRDDERE